VVTRHAASIRAPRERIWECAKTVDVNRSPAARVLFALRRLLAGSGGRAFPLTVESLLDGFILLGERPAQEILFGLIGKPWTARYGARKVAPGEFASFSEPGFAKIVMNFKLAGTPPAVTLSTETRVLCLDGVSRIRFRIYFGFAGPFSGLIRVEMLRLIRNCAELA